MLRRIASSNNASLLLRGTFGKQAKNVPQQRANMHKVVIASAVRTPIGKGPGGKLASLDATKLGAMAIRGAVEKAGVTKSEVQEVIMGNVCQANLGQAPARQAAIHAGLSANTVCTTINKMCASGMKSVMYGAQGIMLGQQQLLVAGGMESMSNIPHYLVGLRTELKKMGNVVAVDGMLRDGLQDAYADNKHMGNCAEETAKKYSLSRESQDQFAIESYKRAIEATKSGVFKNEIISIAIHNKKTGTINIDEDEEPGHFNPNKIPALSPAFDAKGTVTAANASKISDGAAALVLASADKASRAGLKPIARILGFADAERIPDEFTIAPSDAIPKALKMAGLSKSNVDFYEINEAFSAVALANMQILDLDASKVNVFGGAVSLGHPIGCSGARIISTLINVLQQKNGTIGVAAICNGGGGASAIVIERLE